MSDTAYKAALMASWIEAFEAKCEENEYMDTGAASDLLRDLKSGLKRLASDHREASCE